MTDSRVHDFLRLIAAAFLFAREGMLSSPSHPILTAMRAGLDYTLPVPGGSDGSDSATLLEVGLFCLCCSMTI